MAILSSDEFRSRRAGLKLSQAGLAKCLGVHVRTISKWERSINAVPAWVDLALRGIEAERHPAQGEAPDAER